MSNFSVSILLGGTVSDGRNLKNSTLLYCYKSEPAEILEPIWRHPRKETVLTDGQPFLWRFKAADFPFSHFDINPSDYGINDLDDIWIEAWREF